ncbi:WG repeat-containing protein [Flavobacterium selenitireducens]|uniref:WG repeat-containing protein n=1 Tax=Flavobacterium selenitireducens TaxID=2722704 RepID=UPI00168A8E7D|nr:WG repeat-containing protein [Flavobacterium selenitireducens]MBD3584019.1 WG repeat-containing protein [Flavobacterium selenitireducens]
MKYVFYLMLLAFSNMDAQTKFSVKEVETPHWKSIYHLINEKGETIKVLDSSRYAVSFNGDKLSYFAIFLIKGESGWTAIDSDEKVLFKVYNTSFGEPSPDEIVENKIRIVGQNNKIGFADHKGNIIIKPQFEIVTSFSNGKAIIGESCEKKPWGKHEDKDDCQHYSIVCTKHGYIDAHGKILEIGNLTFEEVMKKINWKSPEQ